MPIRPGGNSPIPMSQPAPIQSQNHVEQQMPFSTFQNPFASETPQSTMQGIWSNNYIQPIFPGKQQVPWINPLSNPPNWTNPQAAVNNSTPPANTTQTTPKEIGTQTNTGITPQQQIEIDKQVASRLQEVEIAKARAKDVPKQDSSCQYDPRDLDRLDNPRQYNPRLMEPTSVGSTDTKQKRHRNTGSQTNQQSEPVTSTHSPPDYPTVQTFMKQYVQSCPCSKLLQLMGQTKIVTIEVNITMVVITTTMATTLKIQDAITEVDRIVDVFGLQHQETVQAIEMLTSMSPMIQL